MQESNAVKVKSEVALVAIELLDQAGIEIPFPQRDLRLRAVDVEAAAALSARNGSVNSLSQERDQAKEAESRGAGKS
jgi:small-conductance mechanosensitive channel